MSQRFDGVLRWGPRVLGLLACCYLGLFTLDAFAGDVRFREALLDFLVHAAPVAALLGVVAVISVPLFVVGALFTWSWMNRRGPGSTAA